MRSWSPASRVFTVDCRKISRSTSSRRATHQVDSSSTRFSPNPSSSCQVSRRTCATRLPLLPSTPKARATTSLSKYLPRKSRRDSWRSNQASRQVRLLFLTFPLSFFQRPFFYNSFLLIYWGPGILMEFSDVISQEDLHTRAPLYVTAVAEVLEYWCWFVSFAFKTNEIDCRIQCISRS